MFPSEMVRMKASGPTVVPVRETQTGVFNLNSMFRCQVSHLLGAHYLSANCQLTLPSQAKGLIPRILVPGHYEGVLFKQEPQVQLSLSYKFLWRNVYLQM